MGKDEEGGCFLFSFSIKRGLSAFGVLFFLVAFVRNLLLIG